jgi:hypothetical protein
MCAVLSLMLPYFATGNPRGKTLVFVSGFPDDELSGKKSFLSFRLFVPLL